MSLSEFSFESETAEDRKQKKKSKQTVPIDYDQIPMVKDCRYVPEAFRHNYEIWYWQFKNNNAIKVKSYYFTPTVSFHLFLKFRG